eukprot:m.138223 g.138223  ORF g.138223 m.138223 type:complete len:54 (-) comp15911_c2_seq2:60-221(-)
MFSKCSTSKVLLDVHAALNASSDGQHPPGKMCLLMKSADLRYFLYRSWGIVIT